MSVTSDVDPSRIALLEAVRHQGKEWDVLAPRYGVTNPDPPWKSSLIGMCECLAVGGSLPALDRRKAEDALASDVYNEVPAPERELLALEIEVIGVVDARAQLRWCRRDSGD